MFIIGGRGGPITVLLALFVLLLGAAFKLIAYTLAVIIVIVVKVFRFIRKRHNTPHGHSAEPCEICDDLWKLDNPP